MRLMRSFLALAGVEDVTPLCQRARVNAEERQVADMRVVHQLERQRRELRAIGRLAALVRAGIDVVTRNGPDIGRRRQVVEHGVEHGLDTLVLERGATEHRDQLAFDRSLTQRGLDLGQGQRFAFQKLLDQLIVHLGGGLDHLLAPLGREIEQFGRALGMDDLLADIVLVESRLHRDQVDDSLEVAFRADVDLNRDRVRAQTLAHLLDDRQEVRARPVHLVDEREARHLVLVRLTPDRLGLRLNARDRAEDRDRAVQNTHRPLDLDREVNVTGRIDDVDTVRRDARAGLGGVVFRAPETGGRCRRDRDAALLLLLHPVHRRRAFMHFADLVVAARVEQDALRHRRLARIDMRCDADISGILDRIISCHGISSVLRAAVLPTREEVMRVRSPAVIAVDLHRRI